MIPFESLITQFAQNTGLPLEVAADNSCTLETEGITITLQYRQDHDDIAIFSPVAMPDDATGFSTATLKRALELSYNGVGTHGGFLGLFDDSLILTSFLHLNGLDADTLAVRILSFADTAHGLAVELADVSQHAHAENADDGINEFPPGKFIRI